MARRTVSRATPPLAHQVGLAGELAVQGLPAVVTRGDVGPKTLSYLLVERLTGQVPAREVGRGRPRSARYTGQDSVAMPLQVTVLVATQTKYEQMTTFPRPSPDSGIWPYHRLSNPVSRFTPRCGFSCRVMIQSRTRTRRSSLGFSAATRWSKCSSKRTRVHRSATDGEPCRDGIPPGAQRTHVVRAGRALGLPGGGIPQPGRHHTRVQVVVLVAVVLEVPGDHPGAWWIFHVDLPWWASALLLASSVVTALEAAHLARNQGAGSDG